MTTREKLKSDFEKYYADLKASAKLEGYRVNKEYEWGRFLEEHKANTSP